MNTKTLNETLDDLGLKAVNPGHGKPGTKAILGRRGERLFVGRAGEVWRWLRNTGRISCCCGAVVTVEESGTYRCSKCELGVLTIHT